MPVRTLASHLCLQVVWLSFRFIWPCGATTTSKENILLKGPVYMQADYRRKPWSSLGWVFFCIKITVFWIKCILHMHAHIKLKALTRFGHILSLSMAKLVLWADIFASCIRLKKVWTNWKTNLPYPNKRNICESAKSNKQTWIVWLGYLLKYPKWFATELNHSDWRLKLNHCLDWYQMAN